MLTAEIMNWTGHVLSAPRSRIVDVLGRPEVQKTGVYLLIGKDPADPDQSLVYVGQGDSVGTRLARHNTDHEKEFWDYVCVITSKDLNLTTAHVRYLEKRLIEIINDEGRAKLANKTEPAFDRLPEADISDMEEFITRLQVLLPALGIQFIRPTPKLTGTEGATAIPIPPSTPTLTTPIEQRAPTILTRPTADGERSPYFRFVSPGIRARAVEIGGQMIVLAGSQARLEAQSSLNANVRIYRDQLMRSGKLVRNEREDVLQFTADVAFTSPSAAAQAVMGTSRNGRIDWVVEDTNQTYAEWQEAEIRRAQANPKAEASETDRDLEGVN
jgi:hypothetical protein